jgi:hypothetical protein
MVSLTIFKNIFDRKVDKRMDLADWSALKTLLYALSQKKGYKPKKGEKPSKKDAPLISPAVYKDFTSRKNEHVTHWAGWACLDVDDYEGDFSEIINKFGSSEFLCYSTSSSTEEHPKFRLVFPLTRWVEATEIKHLWYALNKEYLDLGDAQTKDFSRMYYVPAKYPKAFNFIFERSGDFINPDELMSKHPYVQKSNDFFDNLPPALQQQIIEDRKARLTNTNITWTSYKDCPFVNRTLIMEYKTLTAGWYHKMYTIMSSIAGKAIKAGYPITPTEIGQLCRELDMETGNWYKGRNLEMEAARAIEFVYRS